VVLLWPVELCGREDAVPVSRAGSALELPVALLGALGEVVLVAPVAAEPAPASHSLFEMRPSLSLSSSLKRVVMLGSFAASSRDR